MHTPLQWKIQHEKQLQKLKQKSTESRIDLKAKAKVKSQHDA